MIHSRNSGILLICSPSSQFASLKELSPLFERISSKIFSRRHFLIHCKFIYFLFFFYNLKFHFLSFVSSWSNRCADLIIYEFISTKFIISHCIYTICFFCLISPCCGSIQAELTQWVAHVLPSSKKNKNIKIVDYRYWAMQLIFFC